MTRWLLRRVVQAAVVDPVAADKQERPYQATRLGYTRRAYAVDRMRAESLGTGFASAEEIRTRVAVWDAATLKRYTERERNVEVIGTGAAWAATLLARLPVDAHPKTGKPSSTARVAAMDTTRSL